MKPSWLHNKIKFLNGLCTALHGQALCSLTANHSTLSLTCIPVHRLSPWQTLHDITLSQTFCPFPLLQTTPSPPHFHSPPSLLPPSLPTLLITASILAFLEGVLLSCLVILNGLSYLYPVTPILGVLHLTPYSSFL